MRAAVAQGPPYLTKKECDPDDDKCKKHGGFDGFCVELAEKIADMCEFTFEIKLVKDGKYGAREDNGTWNGMVGELIRKVSSACV